MPHQPPLRKQTERFFGTVVDTSSRGATRGPSKGRTAPLRTVRGGDNEGATFHGRKSSKNLLTDIDPKLSAFFVQNTMTHLLQVRGGFESSEEARRSQLSVAQGLYAWEAPALHILAGW